MKLDFHRIGVKFFFVTIAIEGRRPVLSELAGENSRPNLLPAGEVVRSALRALHLARPGIGVSDYVIMPDHVHFVMLVDCDKDRIASPLWLTHRLLDAVEMALQGGVGKMRGEIEPALLARYLRAVCAADDAAHGYAAGVGEPTGAAAPAPPPGPPAGGAPGSAALAPGSAGGAPGFAALAPGPAGGAGGVPPSVPRAPRGVRPTALFERSPYIELSFDSRQLQAIRRYIRLNPARKLWRLAHPDRFRRVSGLRHRFLDPGRSWSAIGDVTLFASPFLFPVRLTLKKSVEEHGPAIGEIVEKARHGFIPVSGFISPGEREALRRLKAEPRARFIKLLPCALPPNYDPSAEDSRELAAGRMLILSGFSRTPALSAIEMRGNPAIARAFRKNCLEMNDLAVALCNAATAGESK